MEDTSVERVGGAFIDEERSLKLPQKRSSESQSESQIRVGIKWVRDDEVNVMVSTTAVSLIKAAAYVCCAFLECVDS